jgi:carbon storage regulator
MLVLARKKHERIVIEHPAGLITIVVTHIDAGKIRIGIDAPREMPIHREDHLQPPPGRSRK